MRWKDRLAMNYNSKIQIRDKGTYGGVKGNARPMKVRADNVLKHYYGYFGIRTKKKARVWLNEK